MAKALEAPVGGQEDLAAPGRPIWPVAHAIAGHAHDLLVGRHASLGHEGCHVRVVVLHLHQLGPEALGPGLRDLAREEGGVQIAGHRSHVPQPEQASQVREGAVQELHGLRPFHIAYVLRQVAPLAPQDGAGNHELWPHGHHSAPTGLEGELHGHGHVAPRAPEEGRAPVHHAHHGVIAPSPDAPVVHEQVVGHAAQLAEGALVVRDHGLARHVGRGHHERQDTRVVEQEVVDARVGQHDAHRV